MDPFGALGVLGPGRGRVGVRHGLRPFSRWLGRGDVMRTARGRQGGGGPRGGQPPVILPARGEKPQLTPCPTARRAQPLLHRLGTGTDPLRCPWPNINTSGPAFVAQGIEHRSPKAGVAGSNPAGGTTRHPSDLGILPRGGVLLGLGLFVRGRLRERGVDGRSHAGTMYRHRSRPQTRAPPTTSLAICTSPAATRFSRPSVRPARAPSIAQPRTGAIHVARSSRRRTQPPR